MSTQHILYSNCFCESIIYSEFRVMFWHLTLVASSELTKHKIFREDLPTHAIALTMDRVRRKNYNISDGI